ncbi:hypothetical protein AB6C98_05830 [Vibrio splendidus]
MSTTTTDSVEIQKNFTPLMVNGTKHDIIHLQNLLMKIDIECSNGDTRKVTVYTRPTNHLYTREVYDSDIPNLQALKANGELIRSYVHDSGNYQRVKVPLRRKEDRVFCQIKYNDNKNFPTFVKEVEENPNTLSVLANSGDEATCLSGMLRLAGQPDIAYLVFFKLEKVSSKVVNMLIETGFCVDMNDPVARSKNKVKRLMTPKKRIQDDRKPFVKILLNVLEGRKPFENKVQKQKKTQQKKGKAAKVKKVVLKKKDQKAKKKAMKNAAKAKMAAQS